MAGQKRKNDSTSEECKRRKLKTKWYFKRGTVAIVFDVNGEIWLKLKDIARALKLEDPDFHVTEFFEEKRSGQDWQSDQPERGLSKQEINDYQGKTPKMLMYSVIHLDDIYSDIPQKRPNTIFGDVASTKMFVQKYKASKVKEFEEWILKTTRDIKNCDEYKLCITKEPLKAPKQARPEVISGKSPQTMDDKAIYLERHISKTPNTPRPAINHEKTAEVRTASDKPKQGAKQSDFENIQRENEKLKKQIERMKKLSEITKSPEKSQIGYIATSPSQAKNNWFKVGGSKNKFLLKCRLRNYNSGRHSSDLMYCCHIVEVEDFRAFEKCVELQIGGFRDQKNSEVYVLHWKYIKQAVDLAAEKCNELTDFAANLTQEMYNYTVEMDAIVPEAIPINGVTFRKLKAPSKRKNEIKVDFNDLNEDEQLKLVRGMLKLYLKETYGEDAITPLTPLEVEVPEFFRTLNENGVKFNEKNMKKAMNSLATDPGILIKP